MEYLDDCDYVLMLDSDELLLDDDLHTLKELCENRAPAVISVRLHTYWKTTEYVIDPPEVGTIKVVLRRDVRMVGVREVEAPVHDTDIYCHHLSYVRSDEEVREKIRLSGHAHEIHPHWFERVWKGWDNNPALENLHPVHPSAYRRAVRRNSKIVKAILERWRCG
jgi:hypothetical protein